MGVGDTTYEFTDDQGRGTSKPPDNGFKYVRVRGLKFHCRTAILLWFKERQRFRYPRRTDAYSVRDRSAFEAAMKQAQLAHPFGPYCYRDHAWFGVMDTAIIEVFKRSPTSGTITTEKKIYFSEGWPDGGTSLDLGLLGIFFHLMKKRLQIFRQPGFILILCLAFGAQDTAVARFRKSIRE
ncbi:hypothetical protein V1515DRAFT_623650 [Lipomyces mesembrius]